MNEFVFFINKVVISGLVSGSIYAMGAIGITLIYSILRFGNFAHADIMTFGAFITLLLSMMFPTVGPSIGVPSALFFLPVAMIATSLLCIFIDKTFYQPLRGKQVKPIVIVMASLGITFMLQGIIRMVFGTKSRSLYVDDQKAIFRLELPWELASKKIIITEPQLILFVLLIVCVISLHLFLTRSRLGKAMRAMSDNTQLAQLSGINTHTVILITWIIAGSLAAISGTLLALDVALKPDLSFNLLLPVFTAAILGGVGHIYGAVLGGMIVGLTESCSVFNWAVLLRPLGKAIEWDVPRQMALVPTEYKLVVPFFLLLFILIMKPTGILKGKVIE